MHETLFLYRIRLEKILIEDRAGEIEAGKLILDEVRLSIKERREKKKAEALDLEIAKMASEQIMGEFERQETNDRALAQRFECKMQREAHRFQKSISLMSTTKVNNDDIPNLKKGLLDPWELPKVDIDNVKDGICISIFLPDLIDVSVRVKSNCHSILIDARRSVPTNKYIRKKNKFSCELKVDGNDVLIGSKDVNYEYSSETGVLFTYMENSHVRSMTMLQKKNYISGMFNRIVKH